MRAARAHLNPGGAFGMYNYYREKWLVDRYANTLQVAFGHAPCLDAYGGVAWFGLLMVGLEPGGVACATTWSPSAGAAPAPVTDDYPFPLLANALDPAVVSRRAGTDSAGFVRLDPRSGRAAWADAKLFGSLLYGRGVLCCSRRRTSCSSRCSSARRGSLTPSFSSRNLLSVLAAVEVARRTRFRKPSLLYLALFGGLILAWAIPPELVLSLDVPARLAVAVSLAFAPVFLANLVFAQRFREVSSSTIAFATNLLGAMVGGVLEYSSLLSGYRTLLVVVALLYGCAFISGRKYLVLNRNSNEPAIADSGMQQFT